MLPDSVIMGAGGQQRAADPYSWPQEPLGVWEAPRNMISDTQQGLVCRGCCERLTGGFCERQDRSMLLGLGDRAETKEGAVKSSVCVNERCEMASPMLFADTVAEGLPQQVPGKQFGQHVSKHS